MATFGRCTALASCLVLIAASANATGPSSDDVATARELYKQGADALDAGNAQGAVDKLSQAWALVHTPVIGLDLARAQSKLGRLVEAREAALAVERLAVAFDETARSNEARGEAAKIAAMLEPRIAHLTVTVDGLAGHDATVKLDGNTIPAAALTAPRQANPGPHVATVVTDDGRHAEGSITLSESDTKKLELHLDAPAPPVKPDVPTATVKVEVPAQPTPHSPERSTISPFVWVSVVVAGAGLVTGAITGALSLNESSIVHANCTTTSTTGDSKTVCLPPYGNDLSSANTFATISTIGFVTAGVGVAALIAWFVFAPSSSSKKAATITPFVGPMSGLRGTF